MGVSGRQLDGQDSLHEVGAIQVIIYFFCDGFVSTACASTAVRMLRQSDQDTHA